VFGGECVSARRKCCSASVQVLLIVLQRIHIQFIFNSYSIHSSALGQAIIKYITAPLLTPPIIRWFVVGSGCCEDVYIRCEDVVRVGSYVRVGCGFSILEQ
jgi:hypothetical protein